MMQRKHNIAPVPFTPVECSGAENFSNYHLGAAIVGVPAIFNLALGLSYAWYPVLVAIFALPAFIAYHILQSATGMPSRPPAGLPGKPLDTYMTIKSPELQGYSAQRRIPIATFFEAYFDEKIDLKGDMLETLEARYDWACFSFTLDQASFFLSQWLPETLWHSRKQDEVQVRNHYDRGDDFYNWFCMFCVAQRHCETRGACNLMA